MAATDGIPAISARDLRLAYSNGARALDGVSVDVVRGEFLAVIGPNGSGKSTLLRCIAGLLTPDSGVALLEGKPVLDASPIERARRAAYAPQALEAFPGVSAFDFVLGGRYAHLGGWRLFSARDRDIAREAMQRTNAAAFSERMMSEMSGGERQRVVLARALAQESPLIVLDEPTSALDLSHQLMVCKLIRGVLAGGKKTVVVATHDLNLASQFADRVLLMSGGRVAGLGTPDEALSVKNLQSVYETELARGYFMETLDGRPRPWVLPWARNPK